MWQEGKALGRGREAGGVDYLGTITPLASQSSERFWIPSPVRKKSAGKKLAADFWSAQFYLRPFPAQSSKPLSLRGLPGKGILSRQSRTARDPSLSDR